MESCGKDEICIRVRLDNNMGFYKNRREGLNSCIHGNTISVPHMETQALHTADGMFFLVNSEKKNHLIIQQGFEDEHRGEIKDQGIWREHICSWKIRRKCLMSS